MTLIDALIVVAIAAAIVALAGLIVALVAALVILRRVWRLSDEFIAKEVENMGPRL